MAGQRIEECKHHIEPDSRTEGAPIHEPDRRAGKCTLTLGNKKYTPWSSCLDRSGVPGRVGNGIWILESRMAKSDGAVRGD